MWPDQAVALADDSPGVGTEDSPRRIQNGSQVYSVSLNRDWLSQLGVAQQGEPTLHAVATRPVVVERPAIIIQPARVIER